MKILLQRVSAAAVKVESQTIGAIGPGYVLLIGYGQDDSLDSIRALAEKVVNLRVFPDEQGRFNFSLLDAKGELLLIPNFTLYADTSKGRRPEFFSAMPPNEAANLFAQTAEVFRTLGVATVANGVFGAYMQVRIENDGPVTILLEG